MKKFNFLIMMVDEERYPPVYESQEIKTWRSGHLLAQERLRENGIEFKNHYTGSTACCPSRATIFTGHYPSLHGVTQTTGAAKSPYDPDVFWLDGAGVPTMGDYFKAAGYRTYYKGKWHISEEDILIPGTHSSYPSYNTENGIPDAAAEQRYIEAGRLEKYGFTGWVGPEPHGSDPRKSGSSARYGISGRDAVFSEQAVRLIDELEGEKNKRRRGSLPPWLMVVSFVNPHDIVLFGTLGRVSPNFSFEVGPDIPWILPPPTFSENLASKPRCQLSYGRTYGEAFQPMINTPFYRKLYYQLQENADMEILKVFNALQKSSFYNDTIVLFFSDHGDLLGAHGGLHQKWYNAYEETIHVPLIMHNPVLFKGRNTFEMPTSHVDLLPTMLGMAGVDTNRVMGLLSRTHTEVHPFVGRDLSPVLFGRRDAESMCEPLYFMTDDDPTRGLDQHNFTGWNYNSVIQPNHIETVVAYLDSGNGKELWKYSRYFDNPQFWTNPGRKDDVLHEFGNPARAWGGIKGSVCYAANKTRPIPDEYEMYNLTIDPYESVNLAFPYFSNDRNVAVMRTLDGILREQCLKKRLYPATNAC